MTKEEAARKYAECFIFLGVSEIAKDGFLAGVEWAEWVKKESETPITSNEPKT